MARPATPLSPKELKQLESYQKLDRRPFGWVALISFAFGAVGGLVLMLVLAPPGSTGGWTFVDDAPFLEPVDDVIGTTALAYLIAALLFGGAMAVGSWRITATMQRHRRQLEARLDAYGTDAEEVVSSVDPQLSDR